MHEMAEEIDIVVSVYHFFMSHVSHAYGCKFGLWSLPCFLSPNIFLRLSIPYFCGLQIRMNKLMYLS
jgi:hypothetical protein